MPVWRWIAIVCMAVVVFCSLVAYRQDRKKLHLVAAFFAALAVVLDFVSASLHG